MSPLPEGNIYLMRGSTSRRTTVRELSQGAHHKEYASYGPGQHPCLQLADCPCQAMVVLANNCILGPAPHHHWASFDPSEAVDSCRVGCHPKLLCCRVTSRSRARGVLASLLATVANWYFCSTSAAGRPSPIPLAGVWPLSKRSAAATPRARHGATLQVWDDRHRRLLPAHSLNSAAGGACLHETRKRYFIAVPS